MHHGDDSKQPVYKEIQYGHFHSPLLLFSYLVKNDDKFSESFTSEIELLTKINDITVFFFGIFKKDEASQEAFCFECQNNKIQVVT